MALSSRRPARFRTRRRAARARRRAAAAPLRLALRLEAVDRFTLLVGKDFHDPHPASSNPHQLSDRGRRQGHRADRRRGPPLHRRLRRRGGVLPRPRPSRRAGRACTRSSTSSPMRIPASSPREVAEELADDLIAHAPAGIGHVYFVSGGSEAIEAALKMARQYFVETRRAAAPPLHRAPPELSRQHAGRARGRRQRMAARAVRAAADRDASHRRRASPTATSEPARATEAYGERAARRSSKPRSSSSAPTP